MVQAASTYGPTDNYRGKKRLVNLCESVDILHVQQPSKISMFATLHRVPRDEHEWAEQIDFETQGGTLTHFKSVLVIAPFQELQDVSISTDLPQVYRNIPNTSLGFKRFQMISSADFFRSFADLQGRLAEHEGKTGPWCPMVTCDVQMFSPICPTWVSCIFMRLSWTV